MLILSMEEVKLDRSPTVEKTPVTGVDLWLFKATLLSSSTLVQWITPAFMLSLLSCVQLFATLWTVAQQAPLSMEFSRREYWSGLPCLLPGTFPTQGLNLCLQCLLHFRWIFTAEPPEKELVGHGQPVVHARSYIIRERKQFPPNVSLWHL